MADLQLQKLLLGRLHDRKAMWVLNINSKYSSMMPAPYNADPRWLVIWFVHILHNSVAEASFFLGICGRTLERYISKFLVNGHVKQGPVSGSFGSIIFTPRKELIVLAHQICKPKFLSVVQSPFDNCQ